MTKKMSVENVTYGPTAVDLCLRSSKILVIYVCWDIIVNNNKEVPILYAKIQKDVKSNCGGMGSRRDPITILFFSYSEHPKMAASLGFLTFFLSDFQTLITLFHFWFNHYNIKNGSNANTGVSSTAVKIHLFIQLPPFIHQV